MAHISSPPPSVDTTYDAPVQAVARRFPQLLSDISALVRQDPRAAKLFGRPAVPLAVSSGPFDVLFNAPFPAQAAAALDGLSVDRRVLHCFSSPAEFLQFLTQPDVAPILAHPDWEPMLLLPPQQSIHAQNFFMRVPPAQWPWSIEPQSRSPEPSIAGPAAALLDQMMQMLRHRTAILAAALPAKYSDWPAPAQILRQRQRPLRVLALASSGSVYQQFCARDMTDALIAEGVDARALITSAGALSHFQLLEAIGDFLPDVLLLNGNCRARLNIPQELCVLSWDQDYVLCCQSEYLTSLGPRDRLMIMVADWADDAAQAGISPERLRHVNLGANVGLYHPPASAVQPEYDVLFVGNIHRFENYRSYIGFDQLEPSLQRIMLRGQEKLDQWVLSRGQDEPFVLPDCDAFVQSAAQEVGLAHAGDARHWRFVVNFFRYRIAHYVLRQRYAEALCAGGEFKVGLFGNGWDQFPALAACARPNLPNGQPLRDAIWRSAINLHLHTWTVHHPRLYDTAAAGGFLLVGRVPERYPLSQVFDLGGELDTFGSIPEMKQQIRRYLTDASLRRDMARRAALHAARDHTMQQRMRQAVQFLSEGST